VSPFALLRLSCWAGIAGGVAALAWAALVPLSPALAGATSEPAARHVELAQYPGDSLAHLLVVKDPFRTSRLPAAVTYDPIQGGGASATPPSQRPPLVLDGILWGRLPEAVIEGWPGIEGSRVVRPGDRVAGLAVRRITRRDVVIADADTTWTLTVREPWR